MRKPCIVKQLLTMQGFSIFGPAPGPPFLIFRPGGLRTVTDFIGFAGRRTQTGPPFLIFRPGVRARKPSLLALREVRREPCRRLGRHQYA